MDGIKIRDLIVTYENEGNILNAINNINLDINTDEITVILGKSGCGKTTLLRMIKGIEKPTFGSIEINDLNIAYIFQEPRLMPWLNVFDNVTFGLEKKDIKNDVIDDLISLVGLDDFKTYFPHQLSGGMQSRVSLIRALAVNSNYILMDEPFAALDYFTRETLQNELLKIYEKSKVGIMFVTHNIDEALKLGHKIIVMSDGVIKETFDIRDLNRDLLSDKFIQLKRKIIERIRD
ncbi:MAG: ATP-binding cassette domain-containing protein [Erysipelotrichaceae bacterium]|nr:ATP-binding cassette domain-containing protein [Erysipelotrichaceae bacterium]